MAVPTRLAAPQPSRQARPITTRLDPLPRASAPVADPAQPAPASVALFESQLGRSPETTILPAAQAFAGAVFAAAETARTRPIAPAGDAGELAMIAGIDLSSPAPVAPAATISAPASLDTRSGDWMEGMIDQIEMLTATAGVDRRETRIRLNPDQLGSVDIAIERDGDTTHVRFTAETPATRALLTDATPRLAELADARGLKLGQAQVDLGGGATQSNAQHQQQRHAESRAEPDRPAPAHPIETADDAAESLHRIA